MPGISRDKDIALTGHLCNKTAPCIATARSVFINGIRVLRSGDKLKKHFIKNPVTTGEPPPPKCIPHKARVNRGSRTVFAEGRPVARRFDSADMKFVIGASRNVFAG